MRLLHTSTLELKFFSDDQIPPYAILSHTWEDDEATYQDVSNHPGPRRASKGWAKVQKCCQVATSLELEYVWIDTCCIDKTSSAELSEAINSMFRWYERAHICIAFLTDHIAGRRLELERETIRSCRWFTRGWTLQELVAPAEIRFYDHSWKLVDTRDGLKRLISNITGIPENILETPKSGQRPCRKILDSLSVGERMSWAAKRTTTRPEDLAYSLLGLFDINLPLLYGEGQTKAFRRLQDEIIKSIDDESLYAWSYHPGTIPKEKCFWGLLADSPSGFGGLEQIAPQRSRYLTRSSHRTVTASNRGLLIDLFVTPFPNDKSGTIFLGFLDCEMGGHGPSQAPAVLLQRTSWDNDSDLVRIRPDVLTLSIMNSLIQPFEIADMMITERNKPRSVLQQPKLRQIFVAHNYVETKPPGGVIFHPVLHNLQSWYSVQVCARSPMWHYFSNNSRPDGKGSETDVYEINFEVDPVPAVGDLSEPKVCGVLDIKITRNEGLREWRTCLVAGVEPLPSNPFETPALYFVPWCAFEQQDKVVDGKFEHVLNKATRKTEWMLDELVVGVFELETRFSRLVYHLRLETKSNRINGSDIQKLYTTTTTRNRY